jgi:hypothetical protein
MNGLLVDFGGVLTTKRPPAEPGWSTECSGASGPTT